MDDVSSWSNLWFVLFKMNFPKLKEYPNWVNIVERIVTGHLCVCFTVLTWLRPFRICVRERNDSVEVLFYLNMRIIAF